MTFSKNTAHPHATLIITLLVLWLGLSKAAMTNVTNDFDIQLGIEKSSLEKCTTADHGLKLTLSVLYQTQTFFQRNIATIENTQNFHQVY